MLAALFGGVASVLHRKGHIKMATAGPGNKGHPQVLSKTTWAPSYTRASGKPSTVFKEATPGSKGQSVCIFRRPSYNTEWLGAQEPAARAQSKMLGAHVCAFRPPLPKEARTWVIQMRQARTQIVYSLLQRYPALLSGSYTAHKSQGVFSGFTLISEYPLIFVSSIETLFLVHNQAEAPSQAPGFWSSHMQSAGGDTELDRHTDTMCLPSTAIVARKVRKS